MVFFQGNDCAGRTKRWKQIKYPTEFNADQSFVSSIPVDPQGCALSSCNFRWLEWMPLNGWAVYENEMGVLHVRLRWKGNLWDSFVWIQWSMHNADRRCLSVSVWTLFTVVHAANTLERSEAAYGCCLWWESSDHRGSTCIWSDWDAVNPWSGCVIRWNFTLLMPLLMPQVNVGNIAHGFRHLGCALARSVKLTTSAIKRTPYSWSRTIMLREAMPVACMRIHVKLLIVASVLISISPLWAQKHAYELQCIHRKI